MQVTMLVPTFKKIVLCNVRRMAACIAYRNKRRARIAQHYNVTDSLSTMSPVAACRMYCTDSDSQPRITLPMLVDGASRGAPSFFVPMKLFYYTIFKINPNIDKDFELSEFLKGALHATSLISKALMNKNYESLDGLVSEDMIEILSRKIETLSPNQRQLIAVDNDDIMFYTITDIDVTTDNTGDKHSIKISITCHYNPNIDGKERKTMMSPSIADLSKGMMYIICNYTFVRKYVNNIGGPWIAIFINHYSLM